MSERKRPRVFWYGLIIVFLLALLPRVIYPVSRPMQWYIRAVSFWDALLDGELGGTYQQYHPGVTTMWVAGLGLQIYTVVHGWPADKLVYVPEEATGLDHYPVEAGVAALGIAIALGIGLAYVLMTRLLGWQIGLVGGCLLALDPFYLEQSKVLHVDALLATLMLLSALFLVGYLQLRSWSYLVFGGVFAGLAFLTKSPAIFLVPYTVLIVIWRHLGGIAGLFKSHIWADRIGKIVRDLTVWGFVVGSIFVLFWPAMWVMPGNVLSGMIEGSGFHTETEHRNPNFFTGRVIYDDVGLLFYPATLAWKTTLITLPAFLVAVFLLFRRFRQFTAHEPMWWLLIYACGFVGMMSLVAGKEMRYLVPTFLALDVLAAWGLVRAASTVEKVKRWRGWTWNPAAIIVAALLIQAGSVLRHHPYYGTHYNLLLGGARVAQHVLPLGDQGEGADLAARFLNSYPRAEERTVGVQRRLEELFERTFVGHSEGMELPNLDYYVFDVNSLQRQNRIENWGQAWEACQEKAPLWSVSFDGVPYVWVYPAYQTDPKAFAVDRHLDVQLGDHVHLLGYTLTSDDISAGDTLMATLFWQSDGRVNEDDHVFVHLVDADGQIAAQHDGIPVQGERPTWDWRDQEAFQDEHTLVTDADLPGGVYTLSVGMYDYSTGVRLSAVGPTGERLPDGRIVLQDIRVTGATDVEEAQ
jgi:hypothetical protein